MLKVGLTGGIGSGKTTVANLFADYGAALIDADSVARQVVEPGKPGWVQLRLMLPVECFHEDGGLQRAALRSKMFADPTLKAHVEAVLHPIIRNEIVSLLQAAHGPYVLLSIPLLFESNWQALVDRVIVVDCPELQQIDRAVRRDGCTEGLIRAIMESQWSRQQRLAAADDVIDNSGSFQKLADQVKCLHNLYQSLRLPQGQPVR